MKPANRLIRHCWLGAAKNKFFFLDIHIACMVDQVESVTSFDIMECAVNRENMKAHIRYLTWELSARLNTAGVSEDTVLRRQSCG